MLEVQEDTWCTVVLHAAAISSPQSCCPQRRHGFWTPPKPPRAPKTTDVRSPEVVFDLLRWWKSLKASVGSTTVSKRAESFV